MHFIKIKSWDRMRLIAHGFGTKGRMDIKSTKQGWFEEKIQGKGGPYPIVGMRQVHGANVIVFGGESPNPKEFWAKEGDALITQVPGFALGVFTADCLPILLFDPVKQAIGIVHAGWRGSAKAIAQKTVQKMKEAFNCTGASIKAAMGPCIGPCCLEVDLPVKAAFEEGKLPWNLISTPRSENRWSLNLQAANSYCLELGGVLKKNIHQLNYCTLCHRSLFHSYRGEGQTRGRQLNFIALKKVHSGDL
jgi:polyphenol oxidase